MSEHNEHITEADYAMRDGDPPAPHRTEDILTGACCCECDVYFETPHGHPVLCNSCWSGRGGIPLPKNTGRAYHPERT